MNVVLLIELGRERRREVARDIATCRYARSPRVALGRALLALGALAVMLGTALDEESGRKAEITTA
ncbi:MAG: hypothetical protein ABR591_04740 [Candidatus Velthaea sp.]